MTVSFADNATVDVDMTVSLADNATVDVDMTVSLADNATVDVDMTVSLADKSASEEKNRSNCYHEEDNLLSGFRLMDMKIFSIML